MGVATVGVLYLAVRRVAVRAPGCWPGRRMALTPVAVLMFRFNNPDALLVLLLTLGGLRADPGAARRAARDWLVGGRRARRVRLPHQDAAGVPRGARLRAGLPGRAPRRRCGGGSSHLLGGGLGAWWCPAAGGSPSSSSCPAAWRPYIGGSQTNSVWELIWGYNGLGRLTGDETGQRRRRRRRRLGLDGHRPAVRRRASAVRSPGCCRPRWCSPVAGLVVVGRDGRAPTPAGRRCWCGASWLLVTGADVQLHGRASSTPTTRWRSHRRSPRLVGIGGGAAVVAARRPGGPGSCSPPPWRAPGCGRGCCSAGRPTSCRGWPLSCWARPCWRPWVCSW